MRVTETELAARFGVSRTPVRQAIARLESEGLLTHEPRRGLSVTRPDHGRW
jgi:DNA-binding GntR family transcriptional regulator